MYTQTHTHTHTYTAIYIYGYQSLSLPTIKMLLCENLSCIHLVSQKYKSVPQPVMLKKLNGSMKTYKTFEN